ncbi:hypothetical protein Tco_1303030 [Tanacetum coccineum]
MDILGSSSKAVRIVDASNKGKVCFSMVLDLIGSDMAEEDISRQNKAFMALSYSVGELEKGSRSYGTYDMVRVNFMMLNLLKIGVSDDEDDVGGQLGNVLSVEVLITINTSVPNIWLKSSLNEDWLKPVNTAGMLILLDMLTMASPFSTARGKGDLLLLSPQLLGFGEPINPIGAFTEQLTTYNWIKDLLIVAMIKANDGNIAIFLDFKTLMEVMLLWWRRFGGRFLLVKVLSKTGNLDFVMVTLSKRLKFIPLRYLSHRCL